MSTSTKECEGWFKGHKWKRTQIGKYQWIRICRKCGKAYWSVYDKYHPLARSTDPYSAVAPWSEYEISKDEYDEKMNRHQSRVTVWGRKPWKKHPELNNL